MSSSCSSRRDDGEPGKPGVGDVSRCGVDSADVMGESVVPMLGRPSFCRSAGGIGRIFEEFMRGCRGDGGDMMEEGVDREASRSASCGCCRGRKGRVVVIGCAVGGGVMFSFAGGVGSFGGAGADAPPPRC